MDYTKPFGIAVTAVMLAGGLLWAVHSLRRLFLVAVALGIAGSYRFGTATGGIYPYEVVVVACALWMVVRRATPATRATPFTQRAGKYLAVLAVWWVAGALINGFIVKPDLSFLASLSFSTDLLQVRFMGHLLLTIAVTVGAFWGGATLFNPETDIKRVLGAVICGTTIVSLETVFEWLKDTGGHISRYNFDPPTDLGAGDTSRIALIGAACCLLLLVRRRPRYRALLSAVFLLHLLAIVTVQTRQGYVAALLQFAVLVPLCARLHFNPRQRMSAIAVAPLAAVIVLAGTALLLTTSGFDRSFTSLENPNVEDRVNKAALFDMAMAIFRKNPVIGVGRGEFTIYADVPMVLQGQAVYVATPHNGLAELLAETGLPGAILAYVVCWLLIKRLWRVYKSPYAPLTRALAGITAFMVAYAVVDSFYQTHVMFYTPVQRNGVRTAFVYWFLAGFATGARRLAARRRAGAAETRIGLDPEVRRPQVAAACR
ncbi:MAG: O-antigen ligase family protein [Bryobacteraceae bacterium]|jgi:hypothetical protein